MMNCSLYVKARLSKLIQRLRRGDGGWALSAKGHQSIKHQVMRTLQVAKCDMSIIRQVVKCDMSPGGSAALRCDAIIAMSWSVGQRTRDKGRGRAGSAREEGARAGGEAQSGRAGRAGWSPDQRPQPQPYQPAGWPTNQTYCSI